MIIQVPIIAVFTKYDQFKRDVRMKLENKGCDPGKSFETVVESAFNAHYLASLSETPPTPHVRLESEYFSNQFTPIFNLYSVGMHKHGQRCTDLIDVTANALSADVVTLMLKAVQCNNLELSVKQAIRW